MDGSAAKVTERVLMALASSTLPEDGTPRALLRVGL